MHSRSSLLIGSVLTLTLVACSPQKSPQGTMEDKAMGPDDILVMANDIAWADAPPVLPAGAKIAVLEGDPAKPGPFTLRIQFPASYRIAPHTHPADEHVTVISGTFARGMGSTFDESKLEELGPGGFAMMKTGMQHFAWSKDGAVVQLHGIGPWGLTYVNPADDPRNATK